MVHVRDSAWRGSVCTIDRACLRLVDGMLDTLGETEVVLRVPRRKLNTPFVGV